MPYTPKSDIDKYRPQPKGQQQTTPAVPKLSLEQSIWNNTETIDKDNDLDKIKAMGTVYIADRMGKDPLSIDWDNDAMAFGGTTDPFEIMGKIRNNLIVVYGRDDLDEMVDLSEQEQRDIVADVNATFEDTTRMYGVGLAPINVPTKKDYQFKDDADFIAKRDEYFDKLNKESAKYKVRQYRKFLTKEEKFFAESAVALGDVEKINMVRFNNVVSDERKGHVLSYISLINPEHQEGFFKEFAGQVSAGFSDAIEGVSNTLGREPSTKVDEYAQVLHNVYGSKIGDVSRTEITKTLLDHIGSKYKESEMYKVTQQLPYHELYSNPMDIFSYAKQADVDAFLKNPADKVTAYGDAKMRRALKQATAKKWKSHNFVRDGIMGAGRMSSDLLLAMGAGVVSGGTGTVAYSMARMQGDLADTLIYDHNVAPSSAITLAQIASVPYALVEKSQVDKLLKTSKTAVGAKFSEKLWGWFKEKGITTIHEIGEETLQAGIEASAKVYARELLDAEGITNEQLYDDVVNEFIEAAKTMPWITGASSAVHGAINKSKTLFGKFSEVDKANLTGRAKAGEGAVGSELIGEVDARINAKIPDWDKAETKAEEDQILRDLGLEPSKLTRDMMNRKSQIEKELRDFEVTDQEAELDQEVNELQQSKLAQEMGVGQNVVEVPVAEIKVSEDIENFKKNANKETGVVEGEQLEGDYDRLGTAPIVILERTDGTKEVITGRHRLDLAKRNGEQTIPAQIVKESEGFTVEMAKEFDAESNIRDGAGTVDDYVTYFRGKGLSQDEAKRRGLISRKVGQQGFAIGQYASEDLYASYKAGNISASKAAAIAEGAKGDESLQALGMSQAKKMTAGQLKAFMSIASTMEKTQQEQGDLFGFNDSAIQDMEIRAKVADDKLKEMQHDRNILGQALKKSGKLKLTPTEARRLGITNTNDLDQIKSAYEKVVNDIDTFDEWMTDPEKFKSTDKAIANLEKAQGYVKTLKRLVSLEQIAEDTFIMTAKNGTKVTIKVDDRGNTGASWDRENKVITMGKNAAVKKFTHEVTHMIKDLGLVTEKQWEKLVKVGRKLIESGKVKGFKNIEHLKERYKKEKKQELKGDALGHELVAHAMEYARENGSPAEMRTVYQKITDFLKNITNLIGLSAETTMDVFNNVLEGKPLDSGVESGVDAKGERYSLEDQTETKEFKAWFGDSKVVDEDGKPLVVYHGTNQNIKSFDTDAFNKIEERGDYVGAGFYFTKDNSKAERYAQQSVNKLDGEPNVIPVFLKIENPFIPPADFFDKMSESELIEYFTMKPLELQEKYKLQGYDGLIDGNYGQYAVFSPTQIKSATENVGTFDATNPDIRYSLEEDFTTLVAFNMAKGQEITSDMVKIAMDRRKIEGEPQEVFDKAVELAQGVVEQKSALKSDVDILKNIKSKQKKVDDSYNVGWSHAERYKEAERRVDERLKKQDEITLRNQKGLSAEKIKEMSGKDLVKSITSILPEEKVKVVDKVKDVKDDSETIGADKTKQTKEEQLREEFKEVDPKKVDELIADVTEMVRKVMVENKVFTNRTKKVWSNKFARDMIKKTFITNLKKASRKLTHGKERQALNNAINRLDKLSGEKSIKNAIRNITEKLNQYRIKQNSKALYEDTEKVVTKNRKNRKLSIEQRESIDFAHQAMNMSEGDYKALAKQTPTTDMTKDERLALEEKQAMADLFYGLKDNEDLIFQLEVNGLIKDIVENGKNIIKEKIEEKEQKRLAWKDQMRDNVQKSFIDGKSLNIGDKLTTIFGEKLGKKIDQLINTASFRKRTRIDDELMNITKDDSSFFETRKERKAWKKYIFSLSKFKDDYKKFSFDKETQLSKSNVIYQYLTFRQEQKNLDQAVMFILGIDEMPSDMKMPKREKGYKRSKEEIEADKIQKAKIDAAKQAIIDQRVNEIEKLLERNDLELIKTMEEYFTNSLDDINRLSEEQRGHSIIKAQTDNYFPMSWRQRDTANLVGENGLVNFFNIFSERVFNNLKYNEEADFLSVYKGHVERIEHVKAYSDLYTTLDPILQSDSLSELIKDKTPKDFLKHLRSHTIMVLNDKSKEVFSEKGFAVFEQLWVASKLYGSITTPIKQLASTFTSIKRIGGLGEFIKGVGAYLTNDKHKGLLADILKTGILNNRINHGNEPIISETLSMAENGQVKRAWKKILKIGSISSRYFDVVPVLTTTIAAYDSFYQEAINAHGMTEEAAREFGIIQAWSLAEKGQQSSQVKDVGNVSLEQAGIASAVRRFASSPAQAWGETIAAMNKFLVRGDFESAKGVFDSFVYNWVVTGVMLSFATYMAGFYYKDEEDQEEYFEDMMDFQKMAVKTSTLNLRGAGWFGFFASNIANYAVGDGRYLSNSSMPVDSSLNDIKNVIRTVKGEQELEKTLRRAFPMINQLLGAWEKIKEDWDFAT